MRLQSLTLRQFRSHRELDLAVEPGVNLIVGSNAAGKTNLIEAVSVLATGQSPRGADNESMIQWGETGFLVRGVFAFDDPALDPLTLEMKVRSGAPRVIRENERTPVKLRDLLGRIPLVSFVPEDLSLVKGEPDLRRQAIDMILMQVDGGYLQMLRRFSEILRSRNAALRQIGSGEAPVDTLDPWDAAFVEAGLAITDRRAAFIREFSPRAARVHERVSGGKEILVLTYKPSLASERAPEDLGEERSLFWRGELRRHRDREIAVGSSLIGPQRDDVLFSLNGRPARAFASEGQKRTCAVAFKLAEIPFVEEKLGQRPICLLDDVLSELDHERAEHLLDELTRTGQCLVTLTGFEAWPRHRPLPAAIYRVDAAGVRRDMSLLPASHRDSIAMAN
jgi:DNA replication and repair protein RecF